MSLRVFHVIFIIVCIALCLYVAVWGVREFVATRSNSALGMAGVFVAAGVALVVYSGKAFRKLKDL
jgi:hypothetical protein